jgi:hypothetical protein
MKNSMMQEQKKNKKSKLLVKTKKQKLLITKLKYNIVRSSHPGMTSGVLKYSKELDTNCEMFVLKVMTESVVGWINVYSNAIVLNTTREQNA